LWLFVFPPQPIDRRDPQTNPSKNSPAWECFEKSSTLEQAGENTDTPLRNRSALVSEPVCNNVARTLQAGK
jgi:hypothetical protein